MNRFPRSIRGLARLLAVGAFAVLPSIGGGGATGTGYVAFGTVEDFGSVFVNGIEFFTEGADIAIDGVSGQPESRLRVGMPVRVEGTVAADGATGQATRVAYDADLRGTADGPAFATNDGAAVRVHGLVLRLEDDTRYEGLLGPAAIAAGDRLVASGLRDDGTGTIRATYVARSAAGAGTVLTGVASAVGPSSFVVGDVTVAFDTASVPGLADGRVVRARGPAEPQGGLLAASDVSVVSGALSAAAGAPGSAEGVVARRTATGFTLGGLVVRVDRETKYRNGTASQVVDGVLVEAEGTVQADGSLLAQAVSLPRPDTALAEATVVSRDATGFWLLSADGVRVEVTAQTKFKDRRRARANGFDWKSLRPGDVVQASGDEIDTGVIRASSIERVEATGLVTAKARVRSSAEPAATLLGLLASATPAATFADENGAALTAEAFFARAVGRRVKATGTVSGPESLAVSRFEIER